MPARLRAGRGCRRCDARRPVPGWPQPLAPGSPRTYMKVMARRIDNQDSLDPRTRPLLSALIGRYIRDGQPVGSRTLARHSGLDDSPATIRNILSDPEEIGLLAAPPTSAGRKDRKS